MAKKKTYHTIDELLEQQRQNAFTDFSVGDNKEYHTIDEIKKAATEQGLLTERAPATQPSAQTTSGRRNLMIRNNQIKNDSRQWKQNQVDGSNPFDLRNQVYKTQNETIPRIAQQAASDYVKNRMGYNYISQYGDDTRYSDVSNDISRVQQLKGGAARRGKDTEVYDRALEMLKGYSQRYRLDDTDASPEAVKDREDLYNDNKREISRLNSQLEAEKGGSLNQALRQWLDSYDDNGIITDEDNQYYIDEIKKNTGYDITQYVGGLDSQKRSEKAEQLRATLGEDTSVNDRKRIEAQLDSLNTQNRKYERYQKPIDDYQDVRNDPDFSETSFADIANSDRRDKLSLYSNSHDEEFNNSYDDPVTLSNIVAEGDVNGWGTLTNSEKDIYYHLLDTQGEEAAYKYLDDMKLVLQKRETGYAEEQAKDVASARPLGIPIGGLASVPGKMIGGALAFADDALHTITGEEINPYDPAHRLANETAAVMESDVDYINDKTNGWNIGGFTLGDAYQALASVEEMGLGIGMGTAAYSALMSMDAAQSKAKELYDSGASNEVIATESLASGAFEYVFEKVSLDTIANKIIGGMLTKESAARYITAALMSAGVEGSEEVATEAANYVADIIIRKEQSERQTLIKDYLAQGYSQEEAEKRATDAFIEDLYKSFMGGALAGALGGGYFGGAYNSVKSNIQERSERNQYIRNVGNDVTDAGNAQALLDRAAQIDDSAVKAQAQRTQQALDKANQNSTKSTNNRLSRETGKLYAAMQDSTAQGIQNAEANEIKAAIKSAYAAETGETDSAEVSKAADAIYKSEYTDERLTRSERNLAETAAAQSALESVKNNPDLIESATQKAQERGFRDYVETAKLTQKQEQETKTDDDVDIAEFNYHEDDGKVYTSDGKKQVDIASVASIGDNDITFNLNDGQTESAKALDMPTNQAVLAQSILDVQKKIGVPLTADIANTLYQGYEQSDSPSVSAYMQDAQTVLFNGYANNTAPDSSINLPQELRNQLYSMGRQLAASHTQAQQQNVNARVKGNNSRKGTVTFQDGINRNKLDQRRRAGVDAVEHLSQSLGFDVVFYRSTKDGKGRFSSEYVRKNKFVADGQQAPSGFWRGGKMYLDINAGMNGEGLILFTASHELVHMIREGSPEDFKALSDFLVKNYAEQGVDINDLVRKEMARSTNLTRDQALEEVIAESCETFLRDTTLNDKAQELYKQNPTLWSRIREALKRIVDAVKRWYAVARPQSEEARITNRAGVETLENAYDLWTKGIIKSAENLRNMEKPADDGGARFELREKYNNTVNSKNINREYSDIDIKFSIREEAPPKKTVKGYKVFRIKDGKLYPPMVANPGGADTPVGVWLNADVGERAPDSKTGRAQVKGKGGMSLSFRPGWHLGDIPRASQFDRKNPATGEKDMFPSDFVWAECDCAADVDYQEEAMSYGYTDNGKFRHAYAGLPRVPENGYYKYRTNPRPDTVPWIITGAIKVNRILSDAEVAEILEKNGVKPPERQGGNKTLEELGLNNEHIKRQSRVDSDYLSAVERGDMETAQRMVDEAAKAAGYDIKAYHGTARADRVGNVFLPERATSGPMAYFTDSKEIASNYARDKADTSIAYDSDYDSYYTQFRVNHNGKTVAVSDLWRTLSFAEKQRIKERARHIKFDDEAERIIYDEGAKYGNGNFDDYTLNLHRGNAIDALIESWLESGDLWGEEERFLYVLKLAGIDGVEYFDPDFRDEKVYETYLNISNPYDTSTVDNDFIDRLEDWWSEQDEDEYYKESSGADMWDKNSMTVEDFVGRLSDDLESKTSHAWTSIPDAITAFLKYEGYDGIKDTGGKNGGESHTVWIPFTSEQIKSADPVTYDDNGNVIPLSERFNESNKDIRYQSRDDLFSTDDMFDDDSISSTVAREYITHHEDIGEVLRNIADIDLPSSKVQSIVNRVIRNELGYLDEEARRTLSIELQLALERVSKTDAQDVSNEMINAVRKAVEGARITDERTQTSYQELRDVFKGKKFYLSDEQINQLKEHDMTFDDFRKAMFGKVTIVKRENAKRSINGGYADAQQLSLEGLHDVLDNPEEVLGIRRDEWDNKNYDAPYIIKRAFDTLREQQSQLVTDMYSDEAIDDMAIAIAAKITGDIVEEKYKSKYKGKDSQQIRKALAAQQKQTNDYIDSLVEKLMEKHEAELAEQKERNKQKLAELKTKERERAEKREKELTEHYKEQRAKNVQKRNLTKQKDIVARKLRSLDKKLNRSNKDKTVKEGLRPTATKLLEVGNMLFPETRSLEEMAREGVSDATPAEKKLLDKYVTYLDMRERATTKERRESASNMLAYIRKQLSKEGIPVEVTENGKTVKKKMSVTARERMRYDNSMRDYNKLKLRTALTELEDAYSMVKNSPDGYIADSFDPTIIDLIKDLKNDVGDTLAKDMTSAQLQTLNDIVTRALKSITNANKLFLQSKSMTDTAAAVMNDIKHIRELKDTRNLPMYKAGEFLGWTNFKPIYAMRFIGSDTLTQLYWNIQRGESNWYVDIAEAKEFKDKLDEKYGVGKLNTKNKTDFNYNKKATFTALDGSEFTLNLDQMMDIYAASRREQALQHLLKGGFTFAKDAKGDKFGTLKTGAKVYQLTAETISDIADQLTVNEKKYVEDMQKYLSTVMADKGNEVSMQLHGVKLFNEEIYWSISSTDIYAPQSEVEQEQKNDLVKKIRNAGFTKSTVKNASNPIVVQGFEEKWAGHVNEMSLYHAMTLPLEDFTKVVNYRERGKDVKATTGVRGVLNQAYGNAASNYINQLIDDLNGGIQQRMRVGVADTLVSLAKKGAVLTNLSVVIQQPSAMFRAMAYINPRYFVKATGNKFWSFEDKRFSWTKHNKAYEELIKYAPIAGIKRMGSFDTGSGRGVIDYLSSGGRENLAQRAYRKSDDIASFMPEYADELAWIKIWQAAQHETQARYGYKVGTEQNKVKAGERFTEVVHLTQVYDSTLSRSHAMRGKDFGSKMLTSFMAEPTTYMNMAVDAVVQAKRTGNQKQRRKVFFALGMALVANALLVAIPRAMRDDDEEETFADKYLQAFWDDIISGVNPLNYFPILKDIMSTIEGHSNERMDMTIIGNTISSITKAFENIQKGKFSGNDVINIIGAAAACVGFSFKNLVRDIRSVINTVNTFKNAHYFKEVDEMGLSLPYAYQKAYDEAWNNGYSAEECKSKGEAAARDKIANALKSKYLEAFESNDTDGVDEIRQYMLQSGYYHSKKKNGTDLDAVKETLNSWREKNSEASERANTAEERQKSK